MGAFYLVFGPMELSAVERYTTGESASHSVGIMVITFDTIDTVDS
jgi:hypothetical protein